jgi:hypothetical protein
MVGERQTQHLGPGPGHHRNAERGRCGGHCARRTADRRPDDHVHGVAGPDAHAAQHVQDRGRTHAGRVSRGLALAGRAGPVDLRRPPGRHGSAYHRLRPAGCIVGAGRAGPRARQPRGDARIAHPVHPLLRRLPHLARGQQDRVAVLRSDARDDGRRPHLRASQPRAQPGQPVHPRHRTESGRLFPGPRDGQPLLRRDPCHRRARHAALRRDHRPPLQAVRLSRRSFRRARDRTDGLGRRYRHARTGHPASRWRRPRQRPVVPAVFRGAPARGTARHGKDDRRARSHQGIRRERRTTLPGRRHRPRGSGRQRHAHVDAARHRRSLRPVVQGIHAGDGDGRYRRDGEGTAEAALYGRHPR